MTLRAVFAYNNLDDTADLNAHFKALVKKGVISGGLILPVASSNNITINPFYAASADGMIVNGDAVTTLECVPGQLSLIILRAIYNAPAAPTLTFECMSQASYNTDPSKSSLIIFGSVDLTASSSVTMSTISYEKRDRVDQVGHSRLLGTYSSIAERDSAWPAVVPAAQQTNDLTVVINAVNGQPAFYFWNGTIWSPFGNYEQLSADFATHTSGVVGAGATVHVTTDQKAALVGTGGIPSATNPYVTANDTTRVITADQKAAIDNAKAGGAINAANPLIGDQLPVAITKLIAYTPSVAQDYVNVARGTNTLSLISFGSPVYVGNLGIDPGSNQSSARNRFKVEDAFFNGYSDSDGPLYIVDIQDAAGSGPYSPAADTTNVSSIGYWNPTDQSASLRIKFNRVLAAGKTVYIKFNAKGTVSGLAPGGAYLPATTAFNSGRDAYQESFVQVVGTSTIGTANITQLYLANGSTTTPSLSFGSDHGTGLFYTSALVNQAYSTYTALGVALNTETTVLFTRSSASASPDIAPLDAPLVIEQVVTPDLDVSYRFYQYNNNGSNNFSESGISFGVADYTNGLTKVLSISRGNGNGRADFDSKVYFAASADFNAGTESAPAISFGGYRTGLYYVGTKIVTTTSFYNTIGLTFGGKTAFAFATNTPTNSLAASMEGSMVFEQSVDSGVVTYRRTINVDQDSTANYAHSFGYSTYDRDYVELMSIMVGDVIMNANATANSFITNGVRFYGSGASGTSWHIGNEVSYNGTLVTISKPLTVNGALTATGALSVGSILVNNGTELAPSIGFTGKPNTGFYYVGSVGSLGSQTIRTAVGISIDGVSTVLFGRNAAAPTGLPSNEVPLLIEQYIDPADPSTSSMQIIGFNRTSNDPSTSDISIGFGDYATSFTATAIFSLNGFEVTPAAKFDSSGTFIGYIRTSTSVTSPYYIASTSTAAAPAYRITTGATGIFGSASEVGTAVAGVAVISCQNATFNVPAATTNFSGTTVTISSHTTLNVLGTLSLPGALSLTDLNSSGLITANNLTVNGTFSVANFSTATVTATTVNAVNGNFSGTLTAANMSFSNIYATSVTANTVVAGLIMYQGFATQYFNATVTVNGGTGAPAVAGLYGDPDDPTALNHQWWLAGSAPAGATKLDPAISYHAVRVVLNSSMKFFEYVINVDSSIPVGSAYKVLFLVGDTYDPDADIGITDGVDFTAGAINAAATGLHSMRPGFGTAGNPSDSSYGNSNIIPLLPGAGSADAYQRQASPLGNSVANAADPILVVRDGNNEIGRYRFTDPLARTYGYYDDGFGFELNLIRVANGTGFNSYPQDHLNWVCYILRLGKQ